MYGKWSPNREGPFQVTRVMRGNMYYLKTLVELKTDKSINEKNLKMYYPTIWKNA